MKYTLLSLGLVGLTPVMKIRANMPLNTLKLN